jgi:hypothetical protein
MIGSGKGSLSDQTEWPSTLFAPTSLCYGLYRIDFEEDKGLPPYVVSFCWKGKNLPIYLRTKHTEYNHVIRVSTVPFISTYISDLIVVRSDIWKL